MAAHEQTDREDDAVRQPMVECQDAAGFVSKETAGVHTPRCRTLCLPAVLTSLVAAALLVADTAHGRRRHPSVSFLSGAVEFPGNAIAKKIVVECEVRDFTINHTDMEVEDAKYETASTGLVEKHLGEDGKPVFVGGRTLSTRENFDQWFHDVEGVNVRLPLKLQLNETANGTFAFNDPSFFPIDGMGFGDETLGHNYFYTLELHHAFKYRGGEVFTFRGDDDLWVYINNSLVIDLGGTHKSLEATVRLDDLGFTPGSTLPLDLFFAERHTKDSEFSIETSIHMDADACSDYSRLSLDGLLHNNLGGAGPDTGEEGLIYKATHKLPGGDEGAVELHVNLKKGGEYAPTATELNGLAGPYASIFMEAGEEATLVFKYADPQTQEQLQLNEAYITFFDLGAAADGSSAEYIRVGSSCQVAVTNETEIVEAKPGPHGTNFSASKEKRGRGDDHPIDPSILTEHQKNRAIMVKCANQSEVEVTIGVNSGSQPGLFLFTARPDLLCSATTGLVRSQNTVELRPVRSAEEETQKCCFLPAFHYMCFDERPRWILWC